MMSWRIALLSAIVGMVAMVACARSSLDRTPVEPDRWSESSMLAEGRRYLDDPAFRRAALVGSLTNPSNTYSRQRLTSYGLVTRGWDVLPEYNPRSVVVTREMQGALAMGERPKLVEGLPPIWDGKRPTTIDGWAKLGREVFFRYPLRREVYLEWALARPEVAARVGVKSAPDGSYPGAILFVDTNGTTQVGMTCAICHSDVEGGQLVVGQARRAFDYGALRIAYHEATKTFLEPDLARRMRTWGPGRADVTEDDDEDPVAVPDLWGLRHQGYLTQAGSITQTGPTALAIRQETQLLTSNHQTIRPPRELAFALAMFLYSLKPPTSMPPAADDAVVARGRTTFLGQCASCHSNAALGGDLVSSELVDTDPALANGAARGTHQYRTPALLHVASAGPYFHDGSVRTLEDVLSAERFESTYDRGFLRTGPVSGHRYGVDLSSSKRAELVTYLRTL